MLVGARSRGLAYLCLDGTQIPVDRIAARTERDNNTYHPGENHQFSGNIQIISVPTATPCGSPRSSPGPCMTRGARELVMRTLYPFCRLCPDRHSHLPVLAGKGYVGADIGVRVLHRRVSGGQVLGRITRTYNRFHAALRAPSERANALLQHWHALDPVTLDPLILTRLQLAVR